MCFLKTHILYSYAWFTQNKCIVVLNKEGLLKLNISWPLKLPVLGRNRGQISHVVLVKMHCKCFLIEKNGYSLPTNQNDLFNSSSVDMKFSLSISTKNMFSLHNERSSVIGFT